MVPLDPRPPTYTIMNETDCLPMPGTFVSHFATCPEAHRFSGKNKTQPGRESNEDRQSRSGEHQKTKSR